MKRALCAITLLLAGPLGAQARNQFTFGAGPYRIDRLAGTPVVAMVGVQRSWERSLVGATIGLVRSAGFYDLNAVTVDLHWGRHSATAPVQWHASAGPAGMLGGDSDGTPYLLVGVQATAGLTVWLSERAGLMASGTGRGWLSSGNDRFAPGAFAGLVIGRRP